eukprot:15143654-Alexandrium_andersonii.AAC.1
MGGVQGARGSRGEGAVASGAPLRPQLVLLTSCGGARATAWKRRLAIQHQALALVALARLP